MIRFEEIPDSFEEYAEQDNCEGRTGLNTPPRNSALTSRSALNSRPIDHRGRLRFVRPGGCPRAGVPGLCIAIALVSSPTWAGGGPENVLLLVNSNSVSSTTIANHYIALRKIPASNVVYINWRGGLEECQGKRFWEEVLQPAIQEIENRRLTAQIDYIVYSSDFPWRVLLRSVFPEDAKFEQPTRPIASATGATFFWRYVRDGNPAMLYPVLNWYMPPGERGNDVRCEQLGDIQSRGFRSNYLWNQNGEKTRNRSKGQSYFLSTMLGVTRGRGNSVDEVISYLKRSVAADGKRPRGTIYYLKNKDVRSTTRHNCYDEAAQQLVRLGVQARVLNGQLPQGADNVMGIMTGVTSFDFFKTKSTILPGAICEHLTSFGGDFGEGVGQTPLSEFLRYGAAGASGTVTEPLALQYKFPLPSLHVHYAQGCSLAEAFYQSVAGPYQLLIVGDPLCQPWAVAPKVTMDSVQPDQEVQGMLKIDPKATTALLQSVGTLELFVDGRLIARFKPGQTLELDTAKLADGYHELRVVAADANPVEARGRLILPIRVNNHGASVDLAVSPESDVTATSKVKIRARHPGATAIVLRQNRRQLARIEGESGEVELPAATFGRGPVVLQAQSEGEHPAVSPPVHLEVR